MANIHTLQYVSKKEAEITLLEQEANGLFITILRTGVFMNPGYFSGNLARLSYMLAKIRKIRQNLYPQIKPKMKAVAKN